MAFLSHDILFLLFILKETGLSMGEGKEQCHHCLEAALPRARAAPFMVITKNRVLVMLSIPSRHPKTSMLFLHTALTLQLKHNHSPPDPTTWSVTSSTVMVSEAEAQEEMQVCQLRQQKTDARSHPSNNVQVDVLFRKEHGGSFRLPLQQRAGYEIMSPNCSEPPCVPLPCPVGWEGCPLLLGASQEL